jgi:hypothetical protein
LKSEFDIKKIKIALLVAGLFLCAAVLPLMPVLFFVGLRVVVCCAAIYVSLAIRTQDHPLQAHFIPLALLATLFNPVIPVQLPYSLWLVINLATAVYFLVLAKKL